MCFSRRRRDHRVSTPMSFPKCLIQLGSQTIIAHILTQLYAAGVERVVISVAAGGDKIMDAVRRTPYYSKMHIEFLDLGPDNRDGHARSILAARQYFTRGPFLIHTADHIFDRSIISKFMAQELNENVACVLVETDISGLVGLPETTVKVQLGPEKILRISRELTKYDGIDAGLFLSSVKIFEALDDLASKKSYFSFADALSYFTKFNKLTYLPTCGETWFSIETEEQLAYTKDTDGVSVLSPWTVFLATTPQSFAEDPNVKKSVVIGISAGDKDSGLRVVGSTDSSRIFQGFIVGVANADRRDDDLWSTTISSTRRGENGDVLIGMEDATPLLPLTRRSTFLSSTHSRRTMGASFIDSAVIDDAMVISFPVDDEASQSIDNLSSSRYGYLIEMSQDPSTPVAAGSTFMLAVPGTEAPPVSAASQSKRKELLPSDIEQISLETRGYDDNLEVTVVVKRKVPLIGYMLLALSLFTLSSVGVALDVEKGVAPLLKLFWRQTGTCLVTFILSMYSARHTGLPSMPTDVKLRMIAAGLAYSFYLASYVLSLAYTSVGHATLFNNAHSLLIVLAKLFTGQPVALMEGAGAAVGLIGGAVTTMDTTKAEGDDIVSATAFGDLVALAGAIGGAAYFMIAKTLRPKMELVTFMSCLTGISATCLLIVMILTGHELSLSMNTHHGLFGWLNPTSDRLLIAFYLVFVCDLTGTMGYISVMKYFDPIVISVVCLVEPIVANVMGIVVGVDSIPGALTFAGATLVIGGTLMVILTQNRKTEQHDATEAIKSAINSTPKPLYSSRVKRNTFNYGSVA
ncbi:hypothetical protein PINS_up013117 [Pythium insidiosum]|nr:hypothetical protein PINS_up013117 [Pythium insidiosum]